MDINREITNLFREAQQLQRRIGKLESAVRTGTALPDTQPIDMVGLAERLVLTLEKRDERI